MLTAHQEFPFVEIGWHMEFQCAQPLLPHASMKNSMRDSDPMILVCSVLLDSPVCEHCGI